jgi:hypothetical protein
MLEFKSDTLHTFFCMFKIAIFILIVITGWSLTIDVESIIELLVVATIFSFFVSFYFDTNLYHIDDASFSVYRPKTKFEDKKRIEYVEHNQIVRIILKRPRIHCLSEIIIVCDNSTSINVMGYEIKKSDFYRLLGVLKKDKPFHVEIF